MNKVDVSSKVEGRLEKDGMNLYMDKAKIGKIVMSDYGVQYDMEMGYIFDQNKVYRYERENPEAENNYVEGCDMGWC